MASREPALPKEREYGRAGLFGVLTPPGNPTVEPEMRILLPQGSAMLVSRLIGTQASLRPRLAAYGDNLGRTIAGFAKIRFDALGYACTGASYLREPGDERRQLDRLEAELFYPIVTATEAIEAALRWLGVGRVALVSPYPDWLTQAARAHWERSGLTVTSLLQLPSGPSEAHRIYELTTKAVLDRIAAFDPEGADAVLISGTGMPSLRIILALRESSPLPVLSSNLCLAWALARLCDGAAPGAESALYGGWVDRLALA